VLSPEVAPVWTAVYEMPAQRAWQICGLSR